MGALHREEYGACAVHCATVTRRHLIGTGRDPGRQSRTIPNNIEKLKSFVVSYMGSKEHQLIISVTFKYLKVETS